MLCALIMAGGKGTRFWPLSTVEKPKQFLNLIGNSTMIQMTVDRIRKMIPIERIFICTNEQYVHFIKSQIIDIPERNIIVEPEGRNTSACIALSSFYIKRYFKNSRMLVLPSDHLINNEQEFLNIIYECDNYIRNNKENIITLGIEPTSAETGYGYIRFDKSNKKKHKFFRVSSFVEKPDLKKAQEYIKSGNYLWNCGIFMWKTEFILENIKRYIPNTYETLKSIETINDYDDIYKYLSCNYKYCEDISIDYAVLEKSQNIKVIKCNFGWDDIGTWNAVERYMKKDKDLNIIDGNISMIDSRNNILISNNTNKIITYGIEGLVCLDTNGFIVITTKDRIEDISKIREII